MIKRLLLLFISLLFLSISLTAQTKVNFFAITHVTVIDVTAKDSKSALKSDQTVAVTANRITALGKTGKVRVPDGAKIIDARGKYLIPGLWDMHAHLGLNDAPTEIDMPLLVANGVTGIREMGSDCHPTWSEIDCLVQMRNWQQQIESGVLTGPRILALGSWAVNGPNGLPERAPVFFGAANAEQARQLARYFAERKLDFIKIYSNIPRDSFLALADEAKRLGLSVVGHEPLAVSAVEASNAGQKSFEHARVFLFNCFSGAEDFRRPGSDRNTTTEWRRRMVDEYDRKICQQVFKTFVRNNTRYVPTHLTRKMDAFADNQEYRKDSRSKFIPKEQWKAWNEDADRMVALDASSAGRKAMMDFYIKGLEITGAAHKAGVKVMLGTDSGDSYVFPGFAVHDELQELVKAGLTPVEALRAATLNGAEFLGRESDFGSIAKGKMADFVLLEDNPLKDISNTRKIAAVILNGRLLNRKILDQLLAKAEEVANR